MKKLFIISVIALGVATLMGSCSSDLEYPEVKVSAVTQLYSPTDDYKVTLLASSTASLYFEWANANASDGYAPLYEVLFDLPSGDFSSPVYSIESDDNGARTYATISHKTLDRVASLAGAPSGEAVTVKWGIRTTRGIGGTVSTASHLLTITRLVGFAEVPGQLFITGDATEGGANLANAIACSSPESDCYEIFTRLEAGKNYQFVDAKDGDIRYFYIDGASLKESTDGSTAGQVDKTGVYRINLDFAVATAKMVEITSCGFFFCPDDAVTLDMPYQGNGVWEGTGATPFNEESWGRDERYKIAMDTADGTIYWGPTNSGLDSQPSATAAVDPTSDYWFCTEWPYSQWDNKWKLYYTHDTELYGGSTTITLYLNTTNVAGCYTHFVK